LWLRQTPGTLLSSIPATDWAGDGIDALDEKIYRQQRLMGSSQTMDALLNTSMDGKFGDPVHISWANWKSFFSTRRMVMNFPEGMLCWPQLAETLSTRYRVIALVSQPLPFAKRMMAIYGDGRSLYCMEETRTWMQKNPVRPIGLEDLSVAEYAWVIKWCLDMKALEDNAANGSKLLFVREEDLMSDTNTALINIFKTLGWLWPGDISAHFNVYCQFQKKSSETVSTARVLSVDGGKMALIQLMQAFNIKTYTFDQHALMTAAPHEQSKKDL
jgi:hypothetical protein